MVDLRHALYVTATQPTRQAPRTTCLQTLRPIAAGGGRGAGSTSGECFSLWGELRETSLVRERATCTGQHSPTANTLRQRATDTWRPRARCVQYLSPRAAKRPSATIQVLMQWADVTSLDAVGIPSVKSGVHAGATFSSLTQFASSHLEWTSHARPGLISKYVSSARRAIS